MRGGFKKIRKLVVAAGIALASLVALSGTGWISVPAAQAHAGYERSNPPNNARLPAGSVPQKVQVWFTETLEPRFSELQVVDRAGARVDLGDSAVAPGQPDSLLVGLKPGLSDGPYTIIYKNTSAEDGHTLKGSLAFVVGEGELQAGLAGGSPLDTVESSQGYSNPNANFWSISLRWFNFAAGAVLVGALAFALLVWMETHRKTKKIRRDNLQLEMAFAIGLRRVQRLVWAGLAGMVAGWLCWCLYQTAAFSGQNLGQLFGIGVAEDSRGPAALYDFLFVSRYGSIWLARLYLLGFLACILVFAFLTGSDPLIFSKKPRARFSKPGRDDLFPSSTSSSSEVAPARKLPPPPLASANLAEPAPHTTDWSEAAQVITRPASRPASIEEAEVVKVKEVEGKDVVQEEAGSKEVPPAATMRYVESFEARQMWWWLALLLAGGVLLTTSLNSHAASEQELTWRAILFDWVHLLASGIWAGGLVVLALALAVAIPIIQAGSGDRTRLLAALIPEFSWLAVTCVLILIFTGTINALLQIRDLSELYTTAYGFSLLIKLVLLVPLLLLGAYNFVILSPRIRKFARAGVRKKMKAAVTADTDPENNAKARGGGGAGSMQAGLLGLRFRRSVLAEVVLVGLVLLATAVLTSSAPPKSISTAGAIYLQLDQAGLKIDLAIGPGLPGDNTVEVRLTDKNNGRPVADARLVDLGVEHVLMEMGSPRLSLQAVRTNPGRYIGQGSLLSMSGQWSGNLIIQRQGLEDVRVPVAFEVK